MPQKNGGKCASLYKLALTGGMRELSQTFDPSANIAKGHPQGQGPAKGGLESLPRPQIQFTGPCTALLQHAAAMAQTTTWQCVPHSPGSPAHMAPLPGSRHPKDPRGSQPILHTNHSQPGLGCRGQQGTASTPGGQPMPPQRQTPFACYLEMTTPELGQGGETPSSILSALQQMTTRPQTYPLMGLPSFHGMSGGGGREPSRLMQNEHPGFQRVAVALSKR